MTFAMRVQKVRLKDTQQQQMRLQYAQVVGLDFFEQVSGPLKGGIIRWPHISINTMKKWIANCTTWAMLRSPLNRVI